MARALIRLGQSSTNRQAGPPGVAGNKDYTSDFNLPTTFGNVTGAFGTNANKVPILVRSLVLTGVSVSSNNLTWRLQVANNRDGTGGWNGDARNTARTASDIGERTIAFPTSDSNAELTYFKALAGTTYYYGFYRTDTTSTTAVIGYQSGVSLNTTNNPNGVYIDGTTTVTSAEALSGYIDTLSVPSQPTSVSITNQNTSTGTLTLNWYPPTDDGGIMSAITGGNFTYGSLTYNYTADDVLGTTNTDPITGYRILVSTNGGTPTVLAENVASNGPNNLVSQQVTGLSAGNTYTFYIAAKNAVTDAYNSTYTLPSTINTNKDYSQITAYTGTNITITSYFYTPVSWDFSSIGVGQATIGQAYSFDIKGFLSNETSGVTSYSISNRSSTQINWLTISSSGVLGGTPPTGTVANTYTFNINAANTGQSPVSTLASITISSGAATISFGNNTVTSTAHLGIPFAPPTYDNSLSATVSSGTVSYAVTTGILPPGLSLNVTTGEITGTPTAIGVYPFTVTATAGTGGATATAINTVTVNPTGRIVGTGGTFAPITVARIYNGTAWVNVSKMQYYNGTTWVPISNR